MTDSENKCTSGYCELYVKDVEGFPVEALDSSAITFNGPNGEFGRLFWKDGALHFEGVVDGSARVFADSVGAMLLAKVKKELAAARENEND